MKIKKQILLIVTHSAMLVCGFIAGIYTLPILIAPPSPSATEIEAVSKTANYRAEFSRDLKGSDALHWGVGEVLINQNYIAMQGKLAPGPDYKLYLSPEFVETEVEFENIKSRAKLVGDIKTFNNFLVKVEPNTKLSEFNTLVVWCETFEEFITAAKYR